MYKLLKQQKGQALWIAILIMSAVFMVGLALAGFLLGEMRVARDVGRFVPAIYAADSGIERALYRIRRTGDFPINCPDTSTCTIPAPDAGTPFINNVSYRAVVLDPGVEWCDVAVLNKCIRGIGTLNDINRAFEVSF